MKPTKIEKYAQNYSQVRVRTPREVLKKRLPNFRQIESKSGEEMTIVIVAAELSKLKKYFDVNIDDGTLEILTEEILSDEKTRSLTPHDLQILIRDAAKTEEVYNRLDFNTIWKWVEKYIERRNSERLRLKREQREKEREKNKEESAPMPEELRKKIAKLFKANREEIKIRERDLGEA